MHEPASVEVSREVPKAERAHIYRTWVSKHLRCTEPLAPILGPIEVTE